MDKEMKAALEADGEKLRQLTGEDHGPWEVTMADPKALREIVFSNLNSAIDGDHTELLDWPVEDIAYDLIAFAADCEDYEVADLTPHVQAWLEARKHG